LENNTVEAVLSLPGGVFQPYSGVKTSVLVFKQGGSTDRVLFLHADNDGYKLDAKHDTPIDEDDLPGLVAAYQKRDANWSTWQEQEDDQQWADKWWFATADEIKANDYNFSAGRYRPLAQTQVEHRDPRELLDELAAIETEIMEEIDDLKLSLARQE
jgi:type I restriction enzyme M protein